MSQQSGLTFFAKDQLVCPVCDNKFYREEMRTGRGRMIAGDLTKELRRLYEPTQKFGMVYPLIYVITVCPACFYAAFPADFNDLPGSAVDEATKNAKEGKKMLEGLFSDLNFERSRTLSEGVGSYYLAMVCLDLFPPDKSPTIKQGLCSLRSAWLLSDLHAKYPDENYDYLQKLMYHKARFFYTQAVEYDGDGTESITEVPHLGPDIDKNYGYDGVLFLSAYLDYHYGPAEDPEKRKTSLEKAKVTVGRIFGMGKSSKSKPTAMLEQAKDLHSAINAEIKKELSDV